MDFLRRLGLDELQITRDDLHRVSLLLVVCLVCAVCVVEWAGAPKVDLAVGDVAPQTIKANHAFQYIDQAAREARVEEARDAERPVYVHRAEVGERVSQRLQRAFEEARAAVDQASNEPIEAEASPPEPEAAPAEDSTTHVDLVELASRFRTELGAHVADEQLQLLVDAGVPVEAQELATRLVQRAMSSYVLDDRAMLPADRRPVRVLERRAGAVDEVDVADYAAFRTLREAREQARLELLEANLEAPWVPAVGAIVRSAVRPNTAFDPIETRARADQAAASVPVTAITVKRGTTLFRQGDVLTPADVQEYRALQQSHRGHGVEVELAAVAFFLLMLLITLYHFGSTYIEGFTTRVADVRAVGLLVVLTALVTRLVEGTAPGVADFVGLEAAPASVWFVIPVAGAAMLVRLLVGVPWTVLFSIAAAAVCGLILDLQALMLVFFLLSSIAGAGAVEHTRERMAVLRAGVFTGVVNAACVLLIHLVQLFLGDQSVGLATTMRPFWSMTFALAGGMGSAFVVLGLMPLFEAAGFVTDYRLMELANLNHPLLRQLMIRAPGTYHHSIVVGSLSEAGCEEIGANALQARVAAYFHDIGKGNRPQFFVENQRDGVNRHDKLDPVTSARVIISHVTDGGRMAREHKLPQPIIDNIYMHHGTGLLRYFLDKARNQADVAEEIREEDFRYPGPRPSTREAGVIMLADKVEAATRTIKHPSEQTIRAMISKIVSSVIADGQFEECPLTLQEINQVTETFVRVLVGIYHHRIEYPDTKEISESARPPRAATITMDIPPPPPTAPRGPAEAEDYESVQHLPGS